MRIKIKGTLFSKLTLLVLLSSCANYKLHIDPKLKDQMISLAKPQLKITHTVYLIGDAGNVGLGQEVKPAIKLLKSFLDTATSESTVLFLGDNIYPGGMPLDDGSNKRLDAEHRLDVQIDALENFKGRPIFIPGNHDWSHYGVEGVRRQEKYIEEKLAEQYGDKFNKDDFFLPNNACSGPDVIDVNEQLSILIVDSNWWMVDWDKNPDINDGCELQSREVFAFQLNDVIRKYRSKNCIIASHHPIFTNGTHGGKYTWKQHIFPLTEKSDNLYIPLPVIGTIAQFARATIGTRQDIANGNYIDYIDAVFKPARRNGEYIFASGHEHSLQYFENEGQKFVVSGAGSKTTPTSLGNGALMTYGHYGFSKIEFYEDGSSWVDFIVPDDTKTGGKVVIFSHQMIDSLVIKKKNESVLYKDYKSNIKIKESYPLSEPNKNANGLYTGIFGRHYRDVYNQIYEFDVLHLDTFMGGVKVLKRGGGNQTNSLRLAQLKDQKQWTMRGLKKDASRFVPYPFNKVSGANYIVNDNFLATHPFAPLVIPSLADAANVYHTNPKLYYIPKQPVLGQHNDIFGDEIYLVEERPMDKWSDRESFGHPDDVLGTYDMANKIIKSYKHKIDQKWAVRSRLFDMLIGDWDRHDDQWRWTKIDQKDGTKLYRPIPRDRDQAFSKYDGILPAVARLYAPFLRQLVRYKSNIDNIKWGSWSARHFDASFINELTLEEWIKEAEFIQNNVTDEIIEYAFRKMPKLANELTGEEMQQIMIMRRENLADMATRLYKLLSKQVTIVGTKNADYIEVNRLDDERIFVGVYDLSREGTKDEKIYERIFYRNETKEIYIYGLNGKDRFNIIGDVNKSIKTIIIGGLDHDTFVDISHVRGLKKFTKIHENRQGNYIDKSKETKTRINNQIEENSYIRRGPQFERNILLPFPFIGLNPDDGFLAGMLLQYNTFKFGKKEIAQRHDLGLTYAFRTKGLNVAYRGSYHDVFNRWDFVTSGRFTNSSYAINYFGLGNETFYPNNARTELDYNRVREEISLIQLGVERRIAGQKGLFSVLPFYENIQILNTQGRFIEEISEELLNQFASTFEHQSWLGLRLRLNFKNVIDDNGPQKGSHFRMVYTIRSSLDRSSELVKKFNVMWASYYKLTRNGSLVLANRIGAGLIDGDYQFFQAPSIGGGRESLKINNLRGYRAERFRGKQTFYHNIDLRQKIFYSKNSFLPFSLGVSGSFDYGRVWMPNEDSNKWHSSFGGGIWLAPINYVVLSFNYYKSEEDTRFVFKVGQSF